MEIFFFVPSFGRLEFCDGLLEFWKICIPLGYNILGDGDGESHKATEIIINQQRERDKIMRLRLLTLEKKGTKNCSCF